MLRLVKHYKAPPATSRTEWPEHGPGECVLPFDVSLQQGILEALVASGARGMSSEEVQSRFSLSSKLMALVLVSLKAGFKVRRSCCVTFWQFIPSTFRSSGLFLGLVPQGCRDRVATTELAMGSLMRFWFELKFDGKQAREVGDHIASLTLQRGQPSALEQQSAVTSLNPRLGMHPLGLIHQHARTYVARI
jgi:hypothetical protein